MTVEQLTYASKSKTSKLWWHPDHRECYTISLTTMSPKLGQPSLRVCILHFQLFEWRQYQQHRCVLLKQNLGIQNQSYEIHLYATFKSELLIAINCLPVADAKTNNNPALFSGLIMPRAKIFKIIGHEAIANLVRLDSLNWARYGIVADVSVLANLLNVVTFNPIKGI